MPSLITAKIVFISQRDGGNNIYVMDDDGGNVQRLTFIQRPGTDGNPAWSPDGKRIAFERNVSEDPRRRRLELFVVDRDGSNLEQLTDDNALTGEPSWAPDGRHIAFSSNRNKGLDIYVIDIFTREIRQLTHTPALREWAADPSWSPDGKYIAYRYGKPPVGSTTIYVMNADGKGQHPLVPVDDWMRYAPSWSPDSKLVLYFEALYAPGPVAFKLKSSNVVIQKHGARDRRVLKTPQKWLIHDVCWTDNGKQVLIAAEEHAAPDRQIEIYRYNLSNDKITNITNDLEDDWSPDWISDKDLSVSPMEKQLIRWGQLKELM